jgi:2-keto-3-deoxy-L-rhamnonate aldolase RhmA
MKNRMKKKLQAGKIVLGAQLRFASPGIAELFGYAGFDYVVFDSEHAPQTPIGIREQMQALAATPATPIMRVLKNDPDLMRTYLDMGVGGVLAPFINTVDDARLGAQALRYPPAGTRGYGPSRANQYGMIPDYHKTADEDMLYLPIVESAEAVRNLEAILAVEGVDSFIIGPADLSFSLGIPMEFEHPKFKEAIREIIHAGQAARKPMGTAIYGGDIYNPDIYKSFVDQGFTLLLSGGDEWMLSMCCRKVVECVASL